MYIRYVYTICIYVIEVGSIYRHCIVLANGTIWKLLINGYIGVIKYQKAFSYSYILTPRCIEPAGS